MIKKILAVLCIIFFSCAPCLAEEKGSAYILMESDTRQVIKKKNENMRLPIASTTKIMTAIVAVENADTEDIFTVSQKAQNQEGSSIYLRAGDKIPVKDLLYGLLLNSGNDAAVVLAEGVSGGCEAFSRLMNKKAQEIGCKNTCFKNPSGLTEEGHYSTAYDMALITAYAGKNAILSEIMATKRYNIEQNESITYLKNHNKLLWQYEYCTGGKTGYTKDAGRCLASLAEKDGVRLVAVTLNCPDDWHEHKNMLSYGFENINEKKIVQKGSILATKKINGTKVNLIASEDVTLPAAVGKKAKITGKMYIREGNEEIGIGDPMGFADIYFNGYPVARVAVKSGQRVKKAPFGGIRSLKRFFLKRRRKL